jgi:hypothetical protein
MSLDGGTTLMSRRNVRRHQPEVHYRRRVSPHFSGDHMPEQPAGPLTRPPRTSPRTRRRPGEGGRRIARPLPDPVAIQLRAIPDSAPPYDDGPPPGAGGGDADAFAAAILVALGPAGRPGAGAAAQDSRPAGPGRPAGGRGQARQPAPDPGEWPSRFAQVLAETLAGSRPPAQLTPWTTERARSHIRRLGPMLVDGQRPVVRRVVTSQPAAGVMEMSVVVGFGPRVRALAIRLERERERSPAPGRPGRRARWVCTTVEAA